MSHKESPIVPTVGRIVLVRGTHVLSLDPRHELPAIITGVIEKNTISVEVFGRDRNHNLLLDVAYRPELDVPVLGAAWRWMDYQTQVATKQVAESKVETRPASQLSTIVSTPQSRVLEERDELLARLKRLDEFLSDKDRRAGVSDLQLRLLSEQASIMSRFASILNQRLELMAQEG